MGRFLKVCFGLLAIAIALGILAFMAFAYLVADAGVKTGATIGAGKLQDLKDFGVVDGADEVFAFYDMTFLQDGSEVFLATAEEAMIIKDGRTTAFPWIDVIDVQRKLDSVGSDRFCVFHDDGRVLHVTLDFSEEADFFEGLLLERWAAASDPAE